MEFDPFFTDWTDQKGIKPLALFYVSAARFDSFVSVRQITNFCLSIDENILIMNVKTAA
jgi:hypothetical protein